MSIPNPNQSHDDRAEIPPSGREKTPETLSDEAGNNQGEELTRQVFDGDEIVNEGVGPQPDERRGNMFGGFAEPEQARDEDAPHPTTGPENNGKCDDRKN